MIPPAWLNVYEPVAADVTTAKIISIESIVNSRMPS